jgi:hypothetical protein
MNFNGCRKPFRINGSIEGCKKTNLSEPNCTQTNPSERERGTVEVCRINRAANLYKPRGLVGYNLAARRFSVRAT